MTGTIPRLFGVVPAHDAFEMRADRRTERDLALFVPVGRDLLSLDPQDLSFVWLDRTQRGPLGAADPVTQHIIRIILVFLQVAPGAADDLGPVDIEELPPRIFSFE